MSHPNQLIEIPTQQLLQGQGLTIDEPDLVHLCVERSPAQFSLDGLSEPRKHVQSLAANQGVLLACSDAELRMVSGDAYVRRLGVINFSKLLAFIDQVGPAAQASSEVLGGFVALDLAPEHAINRRTLEYWFIRQVIDGSPSFEGLKTFLRHLENYWLVKYLVSEASQQKNVSDLGDEYGLSYSHFRRVCKAALGNSVKSELKVWRAARSLLDVVGGRETMTEIAIKHGYASSSHFSTEIKNLFGLSPRAIMELNIKT